MKLFPPDCDLESWFEDLKKKAGEMARENFDAARHGSPDALSAIFVGRIELMRCAFYSIVWRNEAVKIERIPLPTKDQQLEAAQCIDNAEIWRKITESAIK